MYLFFLVGVYLSYWSHVVPTALYHLCTLYVPYIYILVFVSFICIGFFCGILGIDFPAWDVFCGFLHLYVNLLIKTLVAYSVLFSFLCYICFGPSLCWQISSALPPHGKIAIILHLN